MRRGAAPRHPQSTGSPLPNGCREDVMSHELAALSNELAGAVEKAGKAVVAVHARPRFGSSGVFWRPGIIVTAEHTIRREEEITVTLPDGTNAPAVLAGSDPGTDVAVLKVEGGSHQPLAKAAAD